MSSSLEMFHHVNTRAVRAAVGRLVVYTAGVHFAMENLSTYALSLPAEAKKRYLEKINIVGSLDPFAGSLGACTDAVPPVDE